VVRVGALSLEQLRAVVPEVGTEDDEPKPTDEPVEASKENEDENEDEKTDPDVRPAD
jgi:hypothetical protein